MDRYLLAATKSPQQQRQFQPPKIVPELPYRFIEPDHREAESDEGQRTRSAKDVQETHNPESPYHYLAAGSKGIRSA